LKEKILLQRAVSKTQAVILVLVLIVAAVSVFLVFQQETPKSNQQTTLTPTPTTTSTQNPNLKPTPSQTISNTPTLTQTPPTEKQSPTPTTSPTSTQPPGIPVIVVSADLLQPYTPGGPTIELILKSNSISPVIYLQAILTLSGRNYTYIFNNVSMSNPLVQNQQTNQTSTLINAGFETNQMYLLEIMGTLQNGDSFDFVTPITITENANQPVAYGQTGNLQLTMTLQKTTYNLGEPINLTLTFTNVSAQTINFTHTGLDFDFQIYNGTNNLVYQWSNFKAIAQFITTIPLKAGENVSENFTWTQTYNFNHAIQGTSIPPGSYNIIGLSGPVYGIQTTPIQLTIVTP
jgi:hypothetical protein